MLSSYSNDNLQPQMANSGSYNFNNITASNQPPALNSYGNQYVNTVKENRSKYGNYLDNALTQDPHKDQKSAFNVVYESNVYNPWGKPGGGAPKLNNNTGKLQTKIAGTLQWNLNGETESDRISRSMSNQSKNKQNLQMFKKNALPSNTPRSFADAGRTHTTYNYNFQEPIGPAGGSQSFSQSQPQQMQAPQQHQMQMPPQPQQSLQPQQMPNFAMSSPGRVMNQNTSFDLTPGIQREAEQRSMYRSLSNQDDNIRPKGFQELNRLANKLNTDNQPTHAYPNVSYWFGRAGEHNKTTIGGFTAGGGSSETFADPRRRKLLDSLENRSPRDMPKIYGLDNGNLPQQNTNLAFVNDPHSNHRNMYENS